MFMQMYVFLKKWNVSKTNAYISNFQELLKHRVLHLHSLKVICTRKFTRVYSLLIKKAWIEVIPLAITRNF